MVADVVIAIVVAFSLFSGYRQGFLKSIFSIIGNIGGAILGLLLALNYMSDWSLDGKKISIALASIFIGTAIGKLLATLVTKGLKATIIRGPLAFFDHIAGAAISVARAVIIIFLVGAVLTWAPWQGGKDAINESSLYPKIEENLPGVITQLKETAKEKLESINLRP
jgi:uncharacterized membrane protein required for colicin V production